MNGSIFGNRATFKSFDLEQICPPGFLYMARVRAGDGDEGLLMQCILASFSPATLPV